MHDVGERLVAQRVHRGLQLADAAVAAAIDVERLACAESGELALDEGELGRLADAYGVDMTAFFGGRITPLQYLAGA
jgi:transcriptional regulator with XRE-family HTH domain